MARRDRWAKRGARMLPVAALAAALVTLTLAWVAPATLAAPARGAREAAATDTSDIGFPAIDPDYLYSQFSYLVTTYQAREAGYDSAQSSQTTGHDGFATYWQTEMLRDLAGFGATAVRDPFTIQGWAGRPATSQAFNVEVSVPGVTHPDQVVVIGCHYDGMANSTQSANDDGSGCSIELAVAQALGAYWKAHHLYPARTLRFVAFDAEEQGVYGSFHYVNQTINNDLGNVVAMINEEQNGIGYPLRFLGKASNPLLPEEIYLTPTSNNQIYPNASSFTSAQVANINQFSAVEQRAAPAVFAAFRQLGYTSLTYRDAHNNPVSEQIFTPADLSHIAIAPDTEGSSDHLPFALAGLPALLYIGNYSYYDRTPAPPPWSYPYDQPTDTIQLMNIYASGSEAPATALKLALALPGMLTTWSLAQPAVLGFSAAPAGPVAAMSDLGAIEPGQQFIVSAQGAYDPANPDATLRYAWNFGDGATAQTQTASHTWNTPGSYQVQLTVSDRAGSRKISKTVQVAATPRAQVQNPYLQYASQVTGSAPPNPEVTLPTATNTAPPPTSGGTIPQSGSSLPSWLWQALTGLIVLVCLAVIALAVWRQSDRKAGAATADTSAEDIAARQRRESASNDLLKPRDEP